MSDFFTSPYESSSKDLYQMALSGKSPYDALIQQQRDSAIRQGMSLIGQQTSQLQAGISGDIMSQAASAGVGYSSGVADLVGKQKAKVGEAGQIAQGQLVSNVTSKASDLQLQSLMNTLQLGLGGLSKSSTFGDVMAGLETFANIARGVATGGASMGL